MNCPNCKKEIDDALETCPYCHEILQKEHVTVRPKRTSRFGLFRPIGKEPRDNDQDLPKNPHYQKPKWKIKTNTILWGLAIVFIIYMIIVLTHMYK